MSEMLWTATAAVTSVVACWYGVITTHMWLRSRLVLGPLPSEAHETLRRLLDVSRQGDSLKLTRITLLYSGIGALLVAIAAREWLAVIVSAAPFVLIAWMNVRTTTAPIVLMLGTSTHSSIRRQRAIKYRLSPLRVVSLLDVDVPWDPSLANEMTLDCFRTTNEDDWWLVITRLMDIAPVLVIDAAAETTGVLREGRHILGADLWRKCLYLTPPDASAPVLDRLLPMPGVQRRDLRVVGYEQAADAIAAMVAQLGQRRVGSPLREE
ncbi:MAG: hypothetical protein JXA73_14855 [Acidobacteria bacterium]|nr:hypothetical protein [Acidobacteriota bacterium]